MVSDEQPDDGPIVGPKHIVCYILHIIIYDIVILFYWFVVFWLHVYVNIHTILYIVYIYI